MEEEAKSQPSRCGGRTIGSMGRGRNRQAPIASLRSARSDCGDRDESATLAQLISGRIRHLLGVKVVGHGLLDEAEHGHRAGTPYVVIQADCTDEAYYAEEELAEVARIPGDWYGGWNGRRISGDYVLERRVFPTFALLAGHDRARV